MVKELTKDALRKARKARRWTQAQLAAELGVDVQTVSSWERGTRNPGLGIQNRLCEALETTPQQLGFLLAEEEKPETHQTPAPSSLVFLPSLHGKSTPQESPAASVRKREANRTRMLRRVRTTWIEGVLQQSLHQAALIALGLQEQPDALANPWQFSVQETNVPPRPLPPGTSILQAYDEAYDELLLLGEPGSGKTTLLLVLASALLLRAQQDETQSIPVIFHLASWTQRREPLADWLIEELQTKYRVPYKVAQRWVATDQLLVLLDGLDEVAEVAREVCVKAINTYKQEHASTAMVVCCRRAEYYAQGTRLAFQRALLIQPLTKEQIDEYLTHAGTQLEAVRQAVEEDAEVERMVTTPLMLSIVTLAYQGEARMALETATSLEARREQLFTMYVQRMLTRRGHHRYTLQQTRGWLAWIAQQMRLHHQAELSLERVQPDWLPKGWQKAHQGVMRRLIYGIEGMMMGGIFALFRGGTRAGVSGVGEGLLGWLGAPPGNRILGWMAPGLGGGASGSGSLFLLFAIIYQLVTILVSTSTSDLKLSPRAALSGLAKGVRSGLIGGTLIALLCIPLFLFYGGGILYGIGAGIAGGLCVGLLNGLIATLRYEQSVSQTPQIDSGQQSLLTRLIDGLFVGGCTGLCFGVIDLFLHVEKAGIISHSVFIALCSWAYFSIGGAADVIHGLGTNIHPAETVAWSWRGMFKLFIHLAENARRSLLVGGIVLVSVGLGITCVSSLFYGIHYGVKYGLVYGLIIGCVSAIAAILAAAFKSGWLSEEITERHLFQPNEGIIRSGRHGLFAASLFGPLGGIFSGMVCGVAFGLIAGLPGWLTLSTGFAIVFCVIYAFDFAILHGGMAYVQHYVLRWHLMRAKKLPFQLRRFLDYTTDRILLRRVGGGYIFVHRLLLEYFASLQTGTEQEPGSPSSLMQGDGLNEHLT